MSLLTQLLKAKDQTLALALKQLEDLTGRPGVDTALIGEILHLAYARAGQLGLDPDFNGQELYYALLERLKNDDRRLAMLLGGSDPEDVAQMIPLVVKKVSQLKLHRGGWFIKESVARKLLRRQPPPKIMAWFGYSNVEELLAKESLFEVYGALRFAEENSWLNSFIGQYENLSFKDFEHRSVKIVEYDNQKWGDLASEFIKKKLHNITHLKELGVIFVLPTGQLTRMPGVTLKVLPLLIHYVYEIRLYSAFFKLISVRRNFGALLVDTLVADPARVGVMQGRKVHWRVVQRYFGKLTDEHHPEIFQPHVQPEDLHWRKAEAVLYQIDPELKFWQNLDYVGLDLDGDVVSLNLMDVALSYSNQLEYADRYIYHFREALWNELFMRYLGQPVLEEQVLEQLDNELIAPEKVVRSK
ncbi:hypothetical protein HY346_01730 [Candidatus Microgenomates bacterium]|nr:hypothetical protein [Candidatus Microgenomates bacterium]